MTQWIHAAVALLATATIATFLVSTLLVELFGSPESLVRVKALIVMPGLLVLVPALIATAGSGVYLSRTRRGLLREAKIKRMPFIAANGLLVLIPCALFLSRWAAAGNFDATFYALQLLEIIAGAVNLVLMGLNIRDGMRMTGAGNVREAGSADAIGRDSA